MTFKRSFLTLCTVLSLLGARAQEVNISQSEVTRIVTTLASDEMAGRATFTPGIDKAADFIAAEFKKAGLTPIKGNSYFQEFSMQRADFISASGTLNGKAVPERNIVAFSGQDEISVSNATKDFETKYITAKDTLYFSVQRLIAAKKNYVVFVDTAHARMFNSLKRFMRTAEPFTQTVLFVLSPEQGNEFLLNYKQKVKLLKLKNVVGIIPGESRKDEYVIFSGHYDHLGIGKPNNEQDSIFNGANDDASGITAVITLGKHFKQKGGNARTLIFAAFTAEESGGFGSKHFSQQYDPAKVMAMFNIEMIGTESKWGTNSAYITGFEKSDMGVILGKNLAGSKFTFHPDPYPAQNLFYRSDNATLARLGVPAHTISTSKMDSEKYYHTQDDEVETLDMVNMTEIIKAIALSSASIISGTDSPTRVDTSTLR